MRTLYKGRVSDSNIQDNTFKPTDDTKNYRYYLVKINTLSQSGREEPYMGGNLIGAKTRFQLIPK